MAETTPAEKLASIIKLTDAAEQHVFCLEFIPPESHLDTLGIVKGRTTKEDVALSSAARISWEQGIVDLLTRQCGAWLEKVETDADLNEVKAMILATYEVTQMSDLPAITSLEDICLPQRIGKKHRTYSVMVAVPEEAMLNSLDAFINLAVTKFLLMDPTGVNIMFDVKGETLVAR